MEMVYLPKWPGLTHRWGPQNWYLGWVKNFLEKKRCFDAEKINTPLGKAWKTIDTNHLNQFFKPSAVSFQKMYIPEVKPQVWVLNTQTIEFWSCLEDGPVYFPGVSMIYSTCGISLLDNFPTSFFHSWPFDHPNGGHVFSPPWKGHESNQTPKWRSRRVPNLEEKKWAQGNFGTSTNLQLFFQEPFMSDVGARVMNAVYIGDKILPNLPMYIGIRIKIPVNESV